MKFRTRRGCRFFYSYVLSEVSKPQEIKRIEIGKEGVKLFLIINEHDSVLKRFKDFPKDS